MTGRAGMSESVAVLALVVIAVAISAVVALFLFPYTRSVAVEERVEVSAALKTLPAGAAVLRVTVQNAGSSELRVIGIALSGQSAACNPPPSFPSVPAGKSAEFLLDCTGVTRYGKYVVSVRVMTPAGSTIETQVPVVAE